MRLGWVDGVFPVGPERGEAIDDAKCAGETHAYFFEAVEGEDVAHDDVEDHVEEAEEAGTEARAVFGVSEFGR